MSVITSILIGQLAIGLCATLAGIAVTVLVCGLSAFEPDSESLYFLRPMWVAVLVAGFLTLPLLVILVLAARVGVWKRVRSRA